MHGDAEALRAPRGKRKSIRRRGRCCLASGGAVACHKAARGLGLGSSPSERFPRKVHQKALSK